MVLSFAGCESSTETYSNSNGLGGDVLRFLEHPPLTLNPRISLDATAQRLGALLFFGLTRLDRELRVVPALAESWSTSPDGKSWSFRIRPGAKDHRGEPITPERMKECLENYRAGSPISPLASSLPAWKATRVDRGSVVLELSSPDPYLTRNLTLLRYFRTENPSPCREPGEGEKIWGSGAFQPRRGYLVNLPVEEAFPSQEITVVPTERAAEVTGSERPSALSFRFVRDENTKLLWLLRGDADAVLNGFSLSKTGWLRDKQSDRFKVIERDGVTVEYLAFNLQDPVLSNPKVRRAIAHAIDREPIVRFKHAGFTEPAGSFLPSAIPESFGSPVPYDPDAARRLLEEAGYAPGPDGMRLKLGYKTTSAEIGVERAFLLREMLGKVGIALELQVVEPAVFFASLRQGAFQLYASRWVGASDGSIYLISLHSRQPRNRVRYSSPEMDQLLEAAMREMNDGRRIALLRKIQQKMNEDLPYLPLWFWKNALVLNRDVGGLSSGDLAINGAFEPLAALRRSDRSTK